ncbi:MAG: ABC transporter ATP-binding protein [Rubellimicrobium sp.]|nr:ABC transporter ATP-binding protein [Rubellimicrobium sp.]
MAEVRVEGLGKDFDGQPVLSDISLTFGDGEFFGLLGPSGSGKTTLLRLIAGFLFPDRGRILIGGDPVERIPVERREVGMVFQNYALFPNMSVAENVGFGLRVRGVSRAEEARRVAEVLELVQLGALGARRPHQLSGGQKQRVALARAIVTRPRVLLLDEPLSALDKSLRVEMQIELKRIQREVGITTIFVTHDQEEALTLSDRIGILKGGRLVQEGPPREVYFRPKDAFTAGFLGEANLFSGMPEDGGLRLTDGSLIAWPAGAGPVPMIAVRPENLRALQPGQGHGNRITARLRHRVFAGATGTLVLDWRGQQIKVTAREEDLPSLSEGQEITLGWDRDASIPLGDATEG